MAHKQLSHVSDADDFAAQDDDEPTGSLRSDVGSHTCINTGETGHLVCMAGSKDLPNVDAVFGFLSRNFDHFHISPKRDLPASDPLAQGFNGDDLVIGGPGADTVRSGSGTDLVYGDPIFDSQMLVPLEEMTNGVSAPGKLFCGQALDESLVAPWLHSGGDDIIYTGDGNDEAFGQGGNDALYGQNGKDGLHGGPGNDMLDGGAGDDHLVGGGGSDVFSFGLKENTAPATDTIKDFAIGNPSHGGDIITLRGLLAEGDSIMGRDLGEFLHFLQTPGGTTLQVVSDNPGTPMQEIVFEGLDFTNGGRLTDAAIVNEMLLNGQLRGEA